MMVKRNTNYKQMFLVDNILLDRIKCSSKTNYDLLKSEEKCKECSTPASFVNPETPFPESILQSNRSLTPIDSEHNTSSESSSDDDDNGDGGNPSAMTLSHRPMELSINQIDPPPPEDVSISENKFVRQAVNTDNIENGYDTQDREDGNIRDRSPLRRQPESDVPRFSLPPIKSNESELINGMDTDNVQQTRKTNDDLENVREEERKGRFTKIHQRQTKKIRNIKNQNRKRGKKSLVTDVNQKMESDNDKEDDKVDDKGNSPYEEASNDLDNIRKEERKTRLLKFRQGQAKILRNIQRKNRFIFI